MRALRDLRRFILGLAVLTGVVGFALANRAAGDPQNGIVVIPIHGTIDEGMAHLAQRAIAEANQEGAKAIVFDIDTFGGLVSAATEIRDAALDSKVPTYAYISRRAWSAGALIALSAEHIAMAPGSSIGAAQPIPHDVKTVSALRGEFQATALRNHRDPKLAAAMVDTGADAPEYKRHGEILTLAAEDAKRAHIADSIQNTQADFLTAAHLGGQVQIARYTWGEEVARFATNPEVSALLLTLGMLGLLIEMQTLHGIAGFIGVAALALFFGTHLYAGFSNGIVIALAVFGVLGILFELHVVPGHGAPGIIGGIMLLLAVLFAFGIPFFFVALQTISTAIVLTVALFWVATRSFPENAFMKRITFAGVQGPDYVTSSDFTYLRGRRGAAASFLRPAGKATIDGKRIDVLTEGDFIPEGTPVRVTRVEGARIFVEPVTLALSNLPDPKE